MFTLFQLQQYSNPWWLLPLCRQRIDKIGHFHYEKGDICLL